MAWGTPHTTRSSAQDVLTDHAVDVVDSQNSKAPNASMSTISWLH